MCCVLREFGKYFVTTLGGSSKVGSDERAGRLGRTLVYVLARSMREATKIKQLIDGRSWHLWRRAEWLVVAGAQIKVG